MFNSSNEKLIIFDGASILNDCYYRSLTKEYSQWRKGDCYKEEAFETLLKSSNGLYINAIQGFLKLFFELVDIQNPSHLVVVWGSLKENSFRNNIYPNYKDSASSMDEPLKEQLSNIKKILAKIGVIQYSSDVYESQDLIGSIASFFSKDIETYILTRNSNVLQLLDFAHIWLKTKDSFKLGEKLSLDLSSCPKDYILYDKDLVKTLIGVNYDEITDFKAIVGSKVNGIPGAKGIGNDSVIPLIKHFKSIENLYNIIDKLDKNKIEVYAKEIKEKLSLRINPIKLLLNSKDDVLVSKQLVTIKTDIITELEKNNKPIVLSSFIANFDINKAFNELKQIDLTHLTDVSNANSNKNLLFSSLLQTYNPYILSPLSEHFIGNNLKCLNESNLSNINSVIYLPKIDNILKLRESNVTIDNTNNLNDVCLTKDELKTNEFKEILPDNNLAENPFADDYDENIFAILETLSDESLLKNRFKDELLNISNDNKENITYVTPLETYSVSKYNCNHCNTSFTVISSTPKFCINCGASFKSANNIVM